ncbi:aspartyl protease family protein [Dyella silvatica]|uniref:aspartyl protease family protein n=1 Tax=Dyella silvatica TaxID=2992128 RepID=UPI00224FB126|nr:aspartyl protease family protein [Dyella silvatica]
MICKLLPLGIALMLGLSAPLYASANPSSPDPRAIFAAMKAASGGSRWDAIGELHYEAETLQGGIKGHSTVRADLRSGRNAIFTDTGGERGGQGYDGKHSWFLDEKNLVSVLETEQARRAAVSDSYMTRNDWFKDPATAPAQMQFLGSKREAGREFQTIRISPKDGQPFEVWVDAKTHLLDRTVEHSDTNEVTTTRYSDYRLVDGLRLPFAQRQGNGDAQYDATLRVQRFEPLSNVDEAHFAMPASTACDARIVDGATSATVPFESYGSWILVQLSINGAPPLPFVLDTGAINILTPAAAQQLGINGKGNIAVAGAGEATASMKTAHIESYRLGQIKLDDQRFGILDLPRIMTDRGDRPPVAGLIGYEVLRRFVTRIDYDRHELTFTPTASFRYTGSATPAVLTFDSRTPRVEASINGAQGVFGLDTGDAGELTVFAPFAKAHGMVAKPSARTSESRGVGGKSITTDLDISTLTLGGHTISHPHTSLIGTKAGAFASSSLAGNIGYGILSRFVLTLDYEHRQLFLERGQHFAKPATDKRTWHDMSFDRLAHDRIVITRVDPGSPSAKAGLQVGDQITAIDNTPISQLGFDGLVGMWKHPVGTRVVLQTVRNGATREAVMTLVANP